MYLPLRIGCLPSEGLVEESMTPKERFLNACQRRPVDRPPVWMMRQAGRYLPEYRAVRQQKTTLQMMKDPETACEITLQPVRRLGVDAAILYSDILIVPEAMGLKLDFVKDQGPVFENPVRGQEDIEKLNIQNIPDRCDFVYQTIKRIKKKLGLLPLLGFAGAPFTVGTYMVGGDGSYEGHRLKKFALENRQSFHQLMDKITEATLEYLAKQVETGAEAIQLFDTWAGTLSSEDYELMALPYERKILSALKSLGVPTLLYIKGGSHLFEKMLTSKADVMSIDWRMDLAQARTLASGKAAIQGNLDPAHLYGSPQQIEESISKMIDVAGKEPGYIINLGHGMMPDIPVENAQTFVDVSKKLGLRTVS